MYPITVDPNCINIQDDFFEGKYMYLNVTLIFLFTGPQGQGAVQIANTDEKVKLAEKGKEENKKTSDSYY